MTKEQLLELYEARGDESDFLAAKPLYERALADENADARMLNDYGYLLEVSRPAGAPAGGGVVRTGYRA